MVRTLFFHIGATSSIPGHGTKIPEALQHGLNKQINETFKNILVLGRVKSTYDKS